MVDTSTAPSLADPGSGRRVNRWAVAVVVATLPAWSMSFAESNTGVVFTMFTTIAVLAVAATIDRSSLAVVRRRPAAVILALVLAGAALVSFLFHPSGAGVILTFALVSPIGIVISVTGFSVKDLRTYVAAPLLAGAGFQAVIVAVQSITGDPFLHAILRPTHQLQVTNEWMLRPQGLFEHVYEVGTIALLAIAVGLALLPERGRSQAWFLVGIGAAATTIALTHSRSVFLGLLAVFLIGTVGATRGDRGLRKGLAVVGVAFIIPALLTASAWQVRIQETLLGDVDDASLGRITLMKQAIEMSGDHPVVGVGPNRYMNVLREDYVVVESYPFVVHNEPLMIAAELGIPAAIAFTLLLGWAGVQAYRAGNRPLLLYAAPIPLLVFDVLLYNKPVGLLMFATWCGVGGALWLVGKESTAS